MDCAACHKTAGWEIPADSWNFDQLSETEVSEMTGAKTPAEGFYFNHYKTEFPLTGRHVTVDCRTCHPTLVFPEAETDCISCHTDLHNQTVGSDCARCHNSDNWLVNNVTELHQNNGFPLLGAHAAASCNQCHISETALRFERIGNDCINCHSADYAATTSPNHASAGFSTDCSECHHINSLEWFADQTTHDFFPLTKGHDIADCTRCHTSGFQGTPNACIACHTTDYNQTVNPNHAALSFSTDCAACHTTDPGWAPASFANHNDFYPLNGAHATIANDCAACHNNTFSNTPNTCFGCHSADYNQTSNPNHTSAQFPTDCASCHSETAWTPATFDHDDQVFPIYSGNHRGEWDQCSECHTTANNFSAFSCIDCHEHNDAADLADEHDDVQGYSYTSSACYSCHPKGN